MSTPSTDQKKSWTDKDSTSLGPGYIIDWPGKKTDLRIPRCVGVIYFNTNESTLDENDKYQLSKLAYSYVKHNSREKITSLKFLIYGHADARTAKKGTTNFALAQERAEITKDCLYREFEKRKVLFKVTFQIINRHDLLSRELGQSIRTEPIKLAEWRNAQIFVEEEFEPIIKTSCGKRADTKEKIKTEISYYRNTHERLRKPKSSSWWACHTMSLQPKVTGSNFVKPLVDGEEMMGALYDEISRAEKYVLITGWIIDSEIELKRPGSKDKPKLDTKFSLYSLVRQITSRGVQVRFILWDRIPIDVARDIVSEARSLESAATGGGSCKVILYGEEKIPASLHQKTAVIDGKVGFCGGIDLSKSEGDHWDTNEHYRKDRRRSQKKGETRNWHDIHLRVEGSAVEAIQQNFIERWNVSTKRNLGIVIHKSTEDVKLGHTDAQVLRTIPRQERHDKPKQYLDEADYSTIESYSRAIINAREYIYIENQYFSSPFLINLLIRQLKLHSRLHLIIVVPKKIKYPTSSLAATFSEYLPEVLLSLSKGDRIIVKYPQNSHSEPIYVHSKVMIVDDIYAIIGSANFTERSMFDQDEELGLAWVDHDSHSVRDFRIKLWSEHLNLNEGDKRLLQKRGSRLYRLWLRTKSKRLGDWAKANK